MSNQNPRQNAMNENDLPNLSSADRRVEAMLGDMQPVSVSAQRDGLLFEAGRRSAQRQLTFWRSTSALLVGCVVTAMAFPRPSPGPTPAIVREVPQGPMSFPVERPSLATPVETAEPFAYLQLSPRVLEQGLNGLPDLPPSERDAAIPSLRPLRME